MTEFPAVLATATPPIFQYLNSWRLQRSLLVLCSAILGSGSTIRT